MNVPCSVAEIDSRRARCASPFVANPLFHRYLPPPVAGSVTYWTYAHFLSLRVGVG